MPVNKYYSRTCLRVNLASLTDSDLVLELHTCDGVSQPHHDSLKVHHRFALQKLAASLDAKGLSPETGISASDEDEYGTSIATFLQYGSALSVIDQIGTHAYQGVMLPAAASAKSCNAHSASQLAYGLLGMPCCLLIQSCLDEC